MGDDDRGKWVDHRTPGEIADILSADGTGNVRETNLTVELWNCNFLDGDSRCLRWRPRSLVSCGLTQLPALMFQTGWIFHQG